MNMKRKSTFNEHVVTTEQLEEGINRNADGSENDDLEIDHGSRQGVNFAQPAQGVMSKGRLVEEYGVDFEQISAADPKAYERESTAPCVASPVVMTEEVENKVMAAGMLQSALQNPQALSSARVANSDRQQLARMLDQVSRELPTPDATTYIDNRRVIIPAEVRDVPNILPKVLSMKVLEMLIGEHLCLKVVKCARQAGVCFYQKPCLWVSQRLSQELSKRRIWEKITIEPGDYDDKEETNESAVYQAVAKLFSHHVAEQMQVVCATRRISMHRCLKILIDRVCEIALDEKAPKDYTEKYDNLDTLELALGRLGEVS